MTIIIKKFGGTSVADIPKIKNIAQRIYKEKKSNDSVVIVVSAMGNTTNELFDLAKQISQNPSKRELDMLVTAGERISMSLLSLALQEKGLLAISFTGSQSGVITDIHHGYAKIIDVKAFRIFQELKKEKIVIVAGYQGISTLKEVTTLGRGGSDTTAVALACYLNSQKCEIYTDVAGIYTADPRIVDNPKLLSKISYKEMLAMSYNGAKVMHARAVEFAYKYKINVEIKSSFENKKGTLLVDKIINEEKAITAITSQKNLTQISIKKHISDSKYLFGLIAEAGLELINFKFSDDYLSLLIGNQYLDKFLEILNNKNINFSKKENLQTLSFIGPGISKNPIFLVDVIEYFNKEIKCEIKDVIAKEVSLTFVFETDIIDEILNKTHTWIFNKGVVNDRQ